MLTALGKNKTTTTHICFPLSNTRHFKSVIPQPMHDAFLLKSLSVSFMILTLPAETTGNECHDSFLQSWRKGEQRTWTLSQGQGKMPAELDLGKALLPPPG